MEGGKNTEQLWNRGGNTHIQEREPKNCSNYRDIVLLVVVAKVYDTRVRKTTESEL